MKNDTFVVAHEPFDRVCGFPNNIVFPHLCGKRQRHSDSIGVSFIKCSVLRHGLAKVTFESNAHEKTYPLH